MDYYSDCNCIEMYKENGWMFCEYVEEFREYCLSLPGVSEKMPFPNVADRYSRDVLLTLRNNAILSCSCAVGIFMGIAKKVSSLILTLSCLAPLSPDI